jgi:hypothetical protein
VLGPVHTRLLLRHSRVRLSQSIIAETWLFRAHEPHVFSHSSFSPPFHRATSCPTRRRADAMGSTRRSSDRKRALHDPPPRIGRTPLINKGTKRGAGLGFPMAYGESPQKIGLWGCETSRGKETRLTMSALSFPQLTHILSRIFFTFTMKPVQR